MTDRVREQYEAYPYPARDPREEKKRLLTGSPSHLREIDFYCFGGRRDFARPFRALVAGGGTGDATVMLAQQLADAGSPAEVVHLDLSAASRRIAEARVKARGLKTVRFVEGAIEEAAGLIDVGEGFDYIDCCGVLHHLEDPAAALQALRQMLKPEGGMGLMLYGEVGRTGVYHAQGMLRLLAHDEAAPTRLRLARRLLAALPPTNWLKRNPFIADHREGGDAGIFDLLLHSRDRAYRVDEVAELVILGGLRIAAFVEPARYEPANYVADAELKARFAGLGWLERACVAELLAGNLTKHVFYVVESANPVTPPEPDDEQAIPIYRDEETATEARKLRPGGAVRAVRNGLRLSFALPPLASAILARIDGRRTLGEIRKALAESAPPGPDRRTFLRQFRDLFAALNGLNMLFLRTLASG
ncbi:MAG: class I SAM-dependent methyltransferase [Proteobacteria bacterium]|nr:class I SAM-dependent methyltransferase [Pseudomonadota bacterium]